MPTFEPFNSDCLFQAIGNAFILGGGSGGDFNAGNPLPEPAPQGIVGINCMNVFGDNVQMAFPINHQLAVGSNVQLCINPIGLLAGIPGAKAPEVVQGLMGSGMGGSMQFTIGTAAQFTLGQTFEISIGPPKIEIHSSYKKHGLVILVCAIMGAFAIAWPIIYDVSVHGSHDDYDTSNDPNQTQAQKDAAAGAERSGDRIRAFLTLAYQLVMDAALALILILECAADTVDWFADDIIKKVSGSADEILLLMNGGKIEKKSETPAGWWKEWSGLAFGAPLLLGIIGAELALQVVEDKSNADPNK